MKLIRTIKTIRTASPLEDYLIKHYDITDKKKLELFNFIKSQNITMKLYHGTSNFIYGKILQKGYLLSPYMMGTSDKEARARDSVSTAVDPKARIKGTDQIFLSTNVSQCFSYSKVVARQINHEVQPIEKDIPVVLELAVPVYLLQEIMVPILDNKQIRRIYNEFHMPSHFNSELTHEDNEKDLTSENSKSSLVKLIKNFIDSYEGKESEFTVQLALNKRHCRRSGRLGKVQRIF